jgi:hypothetical protein
VDGIDALLWQQHQRESPSNVAQLSKYREPTLHPPPHPSNVAVIRRAELTAHLIFFEGMWTQLAVAKTAMGAMNIGHAPIQTAMPRVRITRPRYMGLRVKR